MDKPCKACNKRPRFGKNPRCKECQTVYNWYKRNKAKWSPLGLWPDEAHWQDYVPDYFKNPKRFSRYA